ARRSWAAFIVLASGAVLAAAYSAAPGPGALVLLDRLRGLGQVGLPAQVLGYLGDVGLREGRRFVTLWTAGFAVVVLTYYRRLTPRLSLVLLIGLIAGDLLAFGIRLYPAITTRELYATPRTTRLLDLEGNEYRILTTPAFSSGTWTRAMSASFALNTPEDFARFRSAFVPNTNVLSGIPNAWGYSPITIRYIAEVVELAIGQAERQGGRSPMIDFMSARYVFTRANVPDAYDPVHREGFFIWRNTRALPRGYLVTDFTVATDEASMSRAMTERWDPARTVILSSPPQGISLVRSTASPGVITRRVYEPLRVSFDVAITQPAILVLNDTYYPGWKAYVDGAERPILRANHAFRAVALPAGTRRVEFVFAPRSLSLGGAVSAATWLLVLGATLVGHKGIRTSSKPQARPTEV
ncbi:MAG TPA: YfhO family protein, partial [Thermoleophilia bacterium]|nr:YfhO family protein [Thermoleophilia bacterium]